MPLRNLLVGVAGEVVFYTTLGQPLDVLKTHMAAFRGQTIPQALRAIWNRGGVHGFYQGLLFSLCETPSAGVLFYTHSTVMNFLQQRGITSEALCTTVGGAIGGAAASVPMCIFAQFRVAEITRPKNNSANTSPLFVVRHIYNKYGVVGFFRGWVALCGRQSTNWATRFGVAGYLSNWLAYTFPTIPKPIRTLLSSVIGGVCVVWNHPFEVIMVEMQSMASGERKQGGFLQASKRIWQQNGLFGFYRGASGRIALSVWAAVVLVWGCSAVRDCLDTHCD
eukprot:TRINITY_DN113926_c0_g1_i1.p1 TRINITY_DN113926_c0_g1~~TRINITY_DN113926_c0_g1_i1.p1  ORF type:complete len:279 (-),score=23.31 TRINITY_DN113926_c0_g1_i1:22-858(-)